MLRPDDLVGLPDFPLGNLTVSPARRVVENGETSLTLEPRVMQLLVLLARERGKVVMRQTLFDEIWGGVPVGDDSLNRAAAGVRRAIELDRGNLGLETIPRTGYRLNVSNGVAGADSWSRRRLMVGGAAVAALAAGGAAWWSMYANESAAFDDLMRKGDEELAYDDRSGRAIPFYVRAVELRPDDARAYGMLAYARAIGARGVATTVRGVQSSDGQQGQLQAAERDTAAALALDPKQPDARLAQIMLQRSMLDFATTEERILAVLADDPRNFRAMRNLWDVLQCVGRSRDGLAMVERALKVDPLSAVATFPRAQFLWINGRVPEADRVIDRAMDIWPTHPNVLFARYTIFAFTGRPRAALAMLEASKVRPPIFNEEMLPMLRANLAALDQKTPAAIDAATRASLDFAQRRPQNSQQAMMAMSALGQLDAAFTMANTLFVGGGTTHPDKGTSWRFTPFLFTPPMAPMWTDSRFQAVADASGLTEYWSKRGIEPDFRRQRS